MAFKEIRTKALARCRAGNLKSWESKIKEKAGGDCAKAADEIAGRIEGAMTRAKTMMAGMSEKVLYQQRQLSPKVRRCAHAIMRERGITKADKAGTSSAIAICTDRANKGKLKNEQYTHLFNCEKCEYTADDPNGQIHMTDDRFECPNCGGDLDILEFNNEVDNFKLETVNMTGIEIMDMGEWKGIDFDQARFDRIIDNFEKGIIEPYANLDHSIECSEDMKRILKASSLGFMDTLKQVGTKLVASFRQVPKTVAELIQAGALKKRSIEFWRKYKHADGNIYDDVLEAVTFHGANGAPAVHTLSDFVALYKNELQSREQDGDDAGSCETINFTERGNDMGKVQVDEAELNDLRKFKQDHPVDDLEKMKSESAEKDKKIAGLEKYKTDREAKDKVELKAEAEAFVKKQIDDQKLLPKFKDIKVAEYERLAVDDTEEGKKTFKLFKEEIEGRGKIANFGDFVSGEGGKGKGSKVDLKNIDTTDESGESFDKIEETIQEVMKRDGVSYEEAAVSVGVMTEEEAGIKKEGK